MKFDKYIISSTIIFTLIANVSMPIAYSDAELTAPELACQQKKPNYDELTKIWSEAKVKDQNAYKSAFEAMQTAHHNYVGCMFDFAERTILKSDGAVDSGTMDANTLNTGGIPVFSTLVDWMSPDQACLTPDELKEIVQKTDPSQMLAPMMQAYSDYRKHLNKIGNEFDSSGVITNEKGEPLGILDMIKAKNANFGTVKRQRKLEIQSALLAMDLMFTSLKELRLSFVMHVQFQCVLQSLEKYRKALEEMRKVIEPLPALLEDASVTK